MRSPHLRRNMASRKGTNSFASPFRNDLPDWHCQIPGRHPGPPDRNTTWASDDAALSARNLGIVGGHLCRPSSIGSPASDSCGRHCHQRIPGERGRGRERESEPRCSGVRCAGASRKPTHVLQAAELLERNQQNKLSVTRLFTVRLLPGCCYRPSRTGMNPKPQSATQISADGNDLLQM